MFDNAGYAARLEIDCPQEKKIKTDGMPSSEKAFACETCRTREKAEANPRSFVSPQIVFLVAAALVIMLALVCALGLRLPQRSRFLPHVSGSAVAQ